MHTTAVSTILSGLILLVVTGGGQGQQQNPAERLGYAAEAKLLIVHADHIGLARSVNVTSARAFENGGITSGSVMVPSPWFPDPAAYDREHQPVDVGVRITLTAEWEYHQWGGISRAGGIPSFLDDYGHLSPTVEAVAQHAVPVYLPVGKKYNLPLLIPRARLQNVPEQHRAASAAESVVPDGLYMVTAEDRTKSRSEQHAEMLAAVGPGLNQLIVHRGEAMAAASKIRVILDTDANNELDDQHAIAYMLLNGDVFDVHGITVNATRNGGDTNAHAAEAERVVRLCNLHPQIPVYKGANGSFEDIKDKVGAPGFDGVEAVNYIIDRAHNQAPGTLVLLPIGKLTNIALALKKDPSIARNVRIVWLGSNYPDPGEYNQENDEPALNHILDLDVPLEFAVVRYDKPSGTDAVRVTLAEIEQNMPGLGPRIRQPVTGRHGGQFSTFGDYSIDLFRHIQLDGDPPSRALFDMAAVAIVKNPAWATRTEIPAPILDGGTWRERPDNPRRILIWENFDRDAILADFFATMRDYVPVRRR